MMLEVYLWVAICFVFAGFAPLLATIGQMLIAWLDDRKHETSFKRFEFNGNCLCILGVGALVWPLLLLAGACTAIAYLLRFLRRGQKAINTMSNHIHTHGPDSEINPVYVDKPKWR